MAEASVPPGGTSGFLKTCFNGLNALSGFGIITLPYALSKTGWMGLALLFSMGAITCYTAILLQRCMDSNPSIKTYSDVGGAAFGHRGRLIIATCMYLELFIVPTGSLIIEGDNLFNLFPDFGIQVHRDLYFWGRPLFMAMAGLVILPSMWLKDLSMLSFVSAGGVFSTLVILLSILWVGGFDGVGFGNEGGRLFAVGGVPIALSLYAFSYGVHPMVPSFYASIRDKSQFSKALLTIFGLGTLSYTLMAVIGYLMFGANVSSQITLNLPPDKVSSQIAIYTILLIPILKYALIMSPIAEAIERQLPTKFNIILVRLQLRTLLLLSSLIVAIAFPYFVILVALVGAVLCVSASILIPCSCFLKIFWDHRLRRLEIGIVAAIMAFGVAVLMMGVFTSVKETVAKL